MATVTSFDELIYGEDNQSPIRKTLERVVAQAKEDEQRLRIEVRSKQDGVPNTRQEHQFVINPDTVTVDGIMRVLVERLNESPGEEFFGQLRINFSQAGSSGERYGSFTRTIRRPMRMPMGAGFRRRMPQSHMTDEEGHDEDFEGADEMDPMVANHISGMPTPDYHGFGGPPTDSQIVDHHQVQQWLETAFGFTFRSMAQQQAMFERTIRMMESFSLRFGLPHPVEQGIIEQKGGGTGGDDSGIGMLPMLIKAAAHLANAGSPEEAVERAGSMARGTPPPTGAMRHAAIQGAAQMVRQLPRGPDGQERHPPGPPPGSAPTPWAHNGDLDDDGEDAYMDEEDFDLDQPPDLTDLSPEEMKQAVIDWIRKDPSRKAEVMGMLPDLQSELM